MEAAYFDSLASVERITVERSLPDPQIDLPDGHSGGCDLAHAGPDEEFPGPGQTAGRRGSGDAESQPSTSRFSPPLQSAYEVDAPTTAFFPGGKVRVNRETLKLLADLEKLAQAQNGVGKATLQDVFRAQIEQGRVDTEITNLEDSHNSLLAQFQAALGMGAGEPAPPVPQRFESVPARI